MDQRRKIVAELIKVNLITDYNDFSLIASDLENGKSKDDILYTTTVEKWPGLFAWLQERL